MEYKKVQSILIKVLLVNWLVALAKIFVGAVSGSLSILSAGFHSLFDGFSNILGLIGARIAQIPQDPSHPYGHRKYEALAALGIAVLILITCYEFLKSVIGRLIRPVMPEITFLSFLVMGACLIIDFFVYRYENSWGQKLKSTILIADSLHTKTHLFITPSVILGLFFVKAGFPIFDAILASFVIFMLCKLAWEVIKESSVILCDQAWVDIKKIQEIARSIKGIESAHQIRTRGDEKYVFLDMHITLNPNLSLEKAHEISHDLRRKISEGMPHIKDIIIHIEPERDGGVCQCR